MPGSRLPARLRGSARYRLMDVTEWFSDTSGGIRTYLREKARYIAGTQEWSQSIVVPGAADSIQDTEGSRMYRLRGPRIPGQDGYRLLLSASKIGRLVVHEMPSLIEAGSPFISAWFVRRIARKTGVPVVAFYHSNVPALFSSGMLRRASRSYLRRLHAPFAATIASSGYAVEELRRSGVSRVHQVPLGVDTDIFNPERRKRRNEVLKKLGLPEGLLAGFIGRFAREKELELLIGAWKTVERETGVALVLVGAGPQYARLRALASGCRIFFVPFQTDRTDVADLLAALDLYVAPGRVETFGLSSLEALASGTPVVAADQGGVAEQIELSGGGATFESGNPASLASVVTTLLDAARHEDAGRNWLGEKGRNYAVANHSWNVVMDRLFALYRDVIG